MSASLTIPRLEMRGITKRYPGVLANDAIDLAVAHGEVHGIMGENGAGKSTLMSILFGLEQADRGSIHLDGTPVRLRSPIDAIGHGIGMVHQSFRLFDSLTVWENVVFRAEPRRGPFVDRAEACRQVEELARRYGMPVDPLARVGLLPVGVRQRLEILKALYRRARVLILDEPTAVLTPAETLSLLGTVRLLADAGCSVLLITHKLAEAMAVTERLTVLRDGRVAARLTTAEASEAALVRAMTGRSLAPAPAREGAPAGAERLAVDRLCVGDVRRPAVADASFSLRAGEILGIAGVAGNGQSELVEALVGLRPVAGGTIRIDGADVTHASVATRRRAGLAYVAEDRNRTASARASSAADNLATGFHRRPPLARFGLLRPRAVREWACRHLARFDVRIAGPHVAVGTLSGGNLQKVVLARELAHEANILIVEQPTRGVDVGAIEFIHRELAAERARGRAVLLVSSELSEILALSDRILVMFAGRLHAELAASVADEASVGRLMAGGDPSPPGAVA